MYLGVYFQCFLVSIIARTSVLMAKVVSSAREQLHLLSAGGILLDWPRTPLRASFVLGNFIQAVHEISRGATVLILC